jgi:hypothetical protein
MRSPQPSRAASARLLALASLAGALRSADTQPLQLLAIDTPQRTYLDVRPVPELGPGWQPQDGWPTLAQWEGAQDATAVRWIAPFTPGDVLSAPALAALLPAAAQGLTVDATAPPCSARPAPADATAALACALSAAGTLAESSNADVDALVPAGEYFFSAVLDVPARVRLRGAGAGRTTLSAMSPGASAVHLAGNRSGALFLTVASPNAASRLTTPQACGVWVGPETPGSGGVHDTLVVGVEVVGVAAAHFFAIDEHGGVWAGNYAHDGWADAYHHTGGSSWGQVVANRASGPGTRGDDLFAHIGYANDGDPVHHVATIGNFGRHGFGRGLAVVGAGFIALQRNDVAFVRCAGIYLAQEDGYQTFGSFDLLVLDNVIAHANLNLSHSGLLAFADSPAAANPSRTFGPVPHRVTRVAILRNGITDTASGIGGGHGIEVRSSVDTGAAAANLLEGNVAPQMVCQGANFTCA